MHEMNLSRTLRMNMSHRTKYGTILLPVFEKGPPMEELCIPMWNLIEEGVVYPIVQEKCPKTMAIETGTPTMCVCQGHIHDIAGKERHHARAWEFLTNLLHNENLELLVVPILPNGTMITPSSFECNHPESSLLRHVEARKLRSYHLIMRSVMYYSSHGFRFRCVCDTLFVHSKLQTRVHAAYR